MRNLSKLPFISDRGLEVAEEPHVRESAERNTVIEIVSQDGMILQYYPQYYNDREVVLAAVRENGHALQYADPVLRADREIGLAAVQNDGEALELTHLNNDREIVFAAVRQIGRALQYASDYLREDRGIVYAAVRNDGYSLQYASLGLRADPEVIQASMTQNPRARIFAIRPDPMLGRN